MKLAGLITAAVCAATYASAYAQTGPDQAIRVLSEANDLRQLTKMLAPAADEKKAMTTLDLLVGAGFTLFDNDATAWNTPLSIRYNGAGSAWTFGFQTNGFTRGKQVDGARIEGWNDSTVVAAYELMPNEFTNRRRLKASVAVTIPSKGEAASRNYKQKISLQYAHIAGDWTTTATLAMRRTAGTATDQATQSVYGALNVERKIGTQAVSFGAERLVARGEASAVSLTTAYEMPLGADGWRGRWQLIRDLTRPNRSTGIEFDLKRRF